MSTIKKVMKQPSDVAYLAGANEFSTLSNVVYQRLRGDITEGNLRPGSRLVRRKIGRQFGVSPVPVIEALLRLEMDGLVESEPMYGARVKRLTSEGLRNEQILREAIECQAARLCAENATSPQLEELSEKAGRVDELMGGKYDPSSNEGIKEHLNFHLTIARSSGAPLLEKELQRVGFWELMLVVWINVSLKPVPANQHSDLVECFAKGDPNQAEIKMREHLRYGADHLLEALRKAEQVST